MGVEVSLAGSVAIRADAVVIGEERFPGRQGRLVFAYLVAEERRAVPRDELAAVLWGEAAPATWEKALSVIVSKLRALFEECGIDGGEALTGAYGCYRLELPAGSRVDVAVAAAEVAQAEAALAAADPGQAKAQAMRATAVARLPLLPGEEGDWLEERRRELADVLVRGLDCLAAACLDSGEALDAAKWAEEAIALEPFRDSGYRRLMHAHAAAGNRAEALRVYERCRVLLAEELGAYPSPETQALHQDLLAAAPVRPAPAPLPEAAIAPERPPEVPADRPPRRRLGWVLVGGGLLAAVAIATVIALHGTAGSPRPSAASSIAVIDASADRLVGRIPIGNAPSTLGIGAGSVWVLNADDRTVSRIDPRTRRITTTFGTGGTPTDLAVGGGAVWIANGSPSAEGVVGSLTSTAVLRVDPARTAVTHTLELPGSAGTRLSGSFRVPGASQVAAGAGAVWVIDPDLTVSRIDPATGRRAATIHAKATSSIVAGREGVWFIGDGPILTRIDSRTNRIGQTIRVGAAALVGLALGAGSIWASDPEDGLVWRIDPGPDPLTRSIQVGVGATAIAFGNGAVWTTNFVDGTVSRIDPRSHAVRAMRLAGTPQGVAIGAGSAWVSVAGGTRKGVLASPACTAIESGGSRPDVLIASDLPLQGAGGEGTRTMADAIRLVLRRHGFRAGRHIVGYQSCDDSTAAAGGFDLFKCATNANAYARAQQLVGVIGPFNSSCAAVEIPIVNRAAGGPLALISPANTYTGLTRAGIDTLRGEPRRYYPSGIRSYFRVVGADDVQGVADATLAHRLGLHRVYVLVDGDHYGRLLATAFATTARRLGLMVVGVGNWNPRARSYRALAERVARSGAEGVFLGGVAPFHGGEVTQALRARLGRKAVLIAGDGFLPIPALLKASRRGARGMYVSIAGLPADRVGASGRRLFEELSATRTAAVVRSGMYVPETLEAAEVLLAAIADSDGSRASVLDRLRSTSVKDGILGSFSFDANGDMTPSPVTILRVTGGSGGRDLGRDFRGAVVDRVVAAAPPRRG